MADRRPSRIAAARQRAANLKRGLAIASAAAFGLATVWAHGSHPGATAAPAGSAGTVTLDDDGDEEGGFDFGSSSLAPSGDAAPDTSTHAS